MSNTPEEDYYSILKVERDASPDEIKKSFRRLAREYHPDVAGNDPATVERFTKLRQAYETLSDPQRRHEYDNPTRRTAGGQFYRTYWRPPGGHQFDGLHNGSSNTGRKAHASVRQRLNDPNNQLDLEDLFSGMDTRAKPKPKMGARPAGRTPRATDPRATVRDIGEGLREMMNNPGASPQTPPSSSGPSSSGRRSANPGARADERRWEAPQGEDVTVSVDVPQNIAHAGGTVTVNYTRNKRGESGDTLFRYNEIYDLRVPPRTRNGQTLRVSRMGSAGARGGPYGDLVCRIRLTRAASTTPRPAAAADNAGDLDVPISIVEAMLGGRIQVTTPTGAVNISVPAGTSSGTRMRLRGRGGGGADLYVRLRIVVPKTLDAESRALIEQFAALNPDSPRD